MSKFTSHLKSISPIYHLLNLPTPLNISFWWNIGSMLGMMLMIQIITGFFLSMHYCPNTEIAFHSIQHIMTDVKYGWIMRLTHMNGASFFFLFMYLHIGRGLYYNSYKFFKTWNIGVIILLISMATAFLGYVLPWGQMSFWGAMVITNLISAIPYIGPSITEWIWGGFSINNATLNRFYSLHFILPLIILMLVMIHLIFLHSTGSSNPMGTNSNLYKMPFHPYFTVKDSITFIILFMFLLLINFQSPFLLNDPDNFIMANPMSTPAHIKPEWYFLFAYAILRSIPNKLGGVLALFASILILFVLPLYKTKMNSFSFFPLNQVYFWMFTLAFFMLTWSGGMAIEYPFTQLSQMFSVMYFMYFLTLNNLKMIWDNLIISI